MNLQEAMLHKLHEASLKAERDQSLMPQGLQPMSIQQGASVLSRLRGTPSSRPRFGPIRPMSGAQGQAILERLNER